MKCALLSTTMFARPLTIPAPASTFCVPEPEAPKADLVDAIIEAKRLMEEADDDAETWPREGWFDGRKGEFHRIWGGLEFRPYPEGQP